MDLANPQNWHLVSQFQKTALITHQDTRHVRWIPLTPSEFQVSSPILSIYIDNPITDRDWYLGCWASLYIQLNGHWQRIKDKSGEWSSKCRLKSHNLLQYPYIEPVPYKLQLDFPWWHRGVSVEVSEFVDRTGNYLDPITEQLKDVIAGEEIILTNRTTRSSEINSRFVITRFVETTKYQTYQVGRFYTVDGNQEIGDPYIKIEPYRLIVEFTGTSAVESNTIKVRLTP